MLLMKKVLQISMGEEYGGVEELEINWFRNIDKGIKFDFLTPNNKPFKNYEEEIKKLGGNLYNFNISRNSFKGRIIYAFELFKFLKKNKYDILHINSECFLFVFHVVLIAKLCRIKKIVIHSHNTIRLNKIKKIFIELFSPLLIKLTNAYLSCSEDARYSLYTKRFINKNKVIILKNGIDVNKYKYDENVRVEYRKKYSLDEKIVYGHIGRFVEQKNHFFLIDIFYEIQRIQKNSVLLLVGDGVLEDKIKEKVKKLDIEDKVIFLGFRNDVDKILNCMDVFLFPSLYEGLGIAAIEAQTNGLITYCSKEVPIEANISSNFKYFDLKENCKNIAQNICGENLNLNNRKEVYKEVLNNGYDIKTVCHILGKIYKRL